MEITESKNLSNVSKSIVNFTNDVFKILFKTSKDNYICSTLSAHIALSMAAFGADKNTALEMRKVLHISDNDSDLLHDYQRIIGTLNIDGNAEDDSESSISGEKRVNEIVEDENLSKEQGTSDQFMHEMNEEFKLRQKLMQSITRLANKIVISDTLVIYEDYRKLLSTHFRSTSETFNLIEKQKSAEIINKWCTDITNAKIKDIVSPSDFSGNTAILLINAVYFKGQWEHSFKTAIPKTYYLNLLKSIKVPTMCTKRILDYRKLPELNAVTVRLDFMCDKYMEIIIPNRIYGLETIIKNLDKISEKKFKQVRIQLWLPKFEVQSEIKFKEHLIKMGMIDAFNAINANFNKISQHDLFIQSVFQKAFIKVDEFGCEAAAVTRVEAVCLSRRRRIFKPRYITIKANRPFLFRIMDSQLNIPLFIGTVVNPMK